MARLKVDVDRYLTEMIQDYNQLLEHDVFHAEEIENSDILNSKAEEWYESKLNQLNSLNYHAEEQLRKALKQGYLFGDDFLRAKERVKEVCEKLRNQTNEKYKNLLVELEIEVDEWFHLHSSNLHYIGKIYKLP